MMKRRWTLALAMASVSLLQAWDSGVLTAEGFVQGMAAGGALLPAAAVLLTDDPRVRGAAVALAALLLVGARYLSSVHLPELALAAFFPAMLVLFDHLSGLHRSTSRSA
jgi:hypothetical protein